MTCQKGTTLFLVSVRLDVKFVDFTKEAAEINIIVTFVVSSKGVFGHIMKWEMTRQLRSELGSRKLLLIK